MQPAGTGPVRMIHVAVMRVLFSTERFDVVELERGHEAAMLAVYSDAEAMRHVGDGEPATAAEIGRWMEVTADNVARRGYGMSAALARGERSGEVVGFVGLVHPGGQEEPELKYALRREWWGQGVATELAAGAVAWGHGRFGMERIIATVAPAHAASLRVLARCGFERLEDIEEVDGASTALLEWRSG